MSESEPPVTSEPESRDTPGPESPVPSQPESRDASGPESPVPSQPDPPAIDLLAAAVVSTAPGVRGRMLYVGWTEEGLPAATPKAGQLSEAATDSLTAFRNSGLSPRRVPFSALVPAEYLSTGSAVDFADTPQRRAEDQIRYVLLDANEAQREVPLGELAVLQAITDARQPFQALVERSVGELAQDTVPLYTLFAPMPGTEAGIGLALMFRPTVAGHTNEPAFRSFVRLTIGRLLVLDESVPKASRKGYLEVAGRLAGVPVKGGFLATLVTLRGLGFVDFSDDWLRGLQLTGRKAQGQLIRMMRAVGLVEVSDDILAELTDPRPDYNVDALELNRLLDMAEAMAGAARRALS